MSWYLRHMDKECIWTSSMFSFNGTAITHILGLPHPPFALYNQKMASLEYADTLKLLEYLILVS